MRLPRSVGTQHPKGQRQGSASPLRPGDGQLIGTVPHPFCASQVLPFLHGQAPSVPACPAPLVLGLRVATCALEAATSQTLPEWGSFSPCSPPRRLPSRAPSRAVGELQELTYQLFQPKHHKFSWPLLRRFQRLGAARCLPPRRWQCPATAGSQGCASESTRSVTGSNLGIIKPRCSSTALWGAHSAQLSS